MSTLNKKQNQKKHRKTKLHFVTSFGHIFQRIIKMKITVAFNLYNAREKFLSAQHLLSAPFN